MKFIYENGVTVLLEDCVLSHFSKYRQISDSGLEAGGQLYIRKGSDRNIFSICCATGPKKKDKRGWSFFFPNRQLENLEIGKYYKKGFDFVGDWHTHPEDKPIPSKTDIKSVRDRFFKSIHSLDYFVMIIVGRADFPDGLSVSLHNRDADRFLKPSIEI